MFNNLFFDIIFMTLINNRNLKLIIRKSMAILLVLLLCAPFLNFPINTASAKENSRKVTKINGRLCLEDEIIIKFKDSKSISTRSAELSSPEQLSSNDIVKSKVPEGKTLEQFIDEMKKQDNIEFAQPNYIYKLNATVNDPQVLNNNQWHHDTINDFEAWDTTMGTSTVKVAVLDTGADLDHPDLASQISLQTDVVDDDGDADDDLGHGTHVAGIIAATENNNEGGAGVAPNSELIIVDVFLQYFDDESGKWEWGASTTDIIEGINYAILNDADVINMSLGGYSYDPAQESAINAAVDNGIVVVCAAGNDNVTDDHFPSDSSYVISVISTDSSDNKAASSNYGPQKDISAPGENILSTYPISAEYPTGYVYMSGTSMASPVVSGVCALMLSVNPDLSVDQVKNILYSTAVDLGTPGRDDTFGYGRINAEAAVIKATETVSKVTLNNSTLDIQVGNDDSLVATVLPDTALNKNVTWSSSNENIATVTNGAVTGVAEGSANITVTTVDGNLTATCAINVSPNTETVTGVTLDKSTLDLVAGSDGTLVPTILPETAGNKNVTWSTSAEHIATVVDGVVTGVAEGSADVTVTTVDGSFTAVCSVDVSPDPNIATGVTLDKTTLSLVAGGSDTLVATILPDTAIEKNVTWSSSNENIATVVDGTVTAVAQGSADITVTTVDGSFTAVCKVNISPGPNSVTSVTLDKTLLELVVDGSDTLVATALPEVAINKDVTWSSSAKDIASVVDGTVTAVAEGSADIIVTTVDGSYTAICTVNVSPNPDYVGGVTLSKTTMDLVAGGSGIITATVSPDTALNKDVTWTSSDKNVAIVSNGTITAIAGGNADITATTVDGSFTAVCRVNVSPLTPVEITDNVRIKLSMGVTTSVPIFVDGNYDLVEAPSVSLPRQLYTIKLEGGVLNLYYGTKLLTSNTKITFKQHTATEGLNNYLWIDNYEHGDRGYLGDMEFSISGPNILVVNHIYMEDYLYGVVPYEMSNLWPIEALKSQSIAARTYAASNMSGTLYDMVDTTFDQVYKGYNENNTNTIAAINATSKKVLQYGSNLSPTYYAASNGGYTDIPYHVWGGGYDWPFAVAEDPYDAANVYSPYEEIFFPVTINTQNPITVSDNVEGTPNKDNAVQYIKKKIFDSGKLQAAGYDVTTVNDFDLTGVLSLTAHTHDTNGGSEDHSRMPISGINNCVDFIMATGTFKVSASKSSVVSEYEVTDVNLDLRYFDAANGITTYQVFNMSNLRLFVIEAKMDGDTLKGYSIYQRRYGHGVGMSQRGAQQRANDGQTYSEILSFYYPGTAAVVLDIKKQPLTDMGLLDDKTNAAVSCDSRLNVRTGTSTSYTILGTVPNKARIEVTQEFVVPDWHKINYGNATAYVHKDFVILDGDVSVTGVSLNKSSVSLNVGGKYTLIPTITPSNASNKSVTWSTSVAGTATVSTTGEVTAHATGNATITATTVDGEHTATCQITVASTPSQEITSSVYEVDQSNSMLLGVRDEITIAQLKSNLDNNQDNIKIYSADDTEITDTSALVATGMKVKLVIDDVVQDELEICILGDVSGDGVIDITDILYIRANILGTYTLENAAAISAELNEDGIIDITDILYIRAHILGTYDITP